MSQQSELVRQKWLKSVFGKDAQRNNIQNNELISKSPEFLANMKTPKDLIPFGVLRNFYGPEQVKNMYTWETYDWAYDINEYNHRDPWPLDSKPKKVGIFGSSDSFGAGCDKTYSRRLQELLPPEYGVHNTATAGANILVIFKKFEIMTNMMDFDTAIVSLPEAKLISLKDQQFMVLGALTKVMPHTPEWIQLMGNLGLPEYQELHDEIKQGKEGIPLTVFLMKYVDAIAQIAIKKKIKLFFGGWDRALYFNVKEKYPEITLPRWEWFDKAECDNAHPGIASHDKYAVNIFNAMKV
tara:strand:- start:2577 stop:3464 length:888 start_codon:yes stop_codon:yes gene_type:complete